MNKINELLGITEYFKAPTRMMEILFDKEVRETTFMNFLKEFYYDVSYDWFRDYFESEYADRKNKKQDFTPQSIIDLLAKLTDGDSHTIYEPTVGTGGVIIGKWNSILIKDSIFKYEPNKYLFVCEELSDRAIPFLLFNLCIRGMNAVVIHGDVLTRESYGVFLIQNVDNNYLGFSNLNVMPYTEEVEKYFNVKFVEKKYKAHVENGVIYEN